MLVSSSLLKANFSQFSCCCCCCCMRTTKNKAKQINMQQQQNNVFTLLARRELPFLHVRLCVFGVCVCDCVFHTLFDF